tara:strand:- start:51564 stop:52148 length:585 start_codon:yes stop_codon:yes gene_type:complete
LTVSEVVTRRLEIRRGTAGWNSLIVPDEPMNWISDFVTLVSLPLSRLALMFRPVLSSLLLLLVTALQSTQPCCVLQSACDSCCQSLAPGSRCDRHQGSCSCDGGKTVVESSQRRATGKESPNHLPSPQRHECPVCKGELPNLVTKTGELMFDRHAGQETTLWRAPVFEKPLLEIEETPIQRSSSRTRSPGHLLI